MTPEHFWLIAAGAGIVLVFLILVVGAVVLVVHFHEVRELRITTAQHIELKGEMGELKRLTLTAINGRVRMEEDITTIKVQVKDLRDRLNEHIDMPGHA